MIRPTVAIAVALAMAACGAPNDQETGSIDSQEVRRARADLDPDLVEALDSGNAAYRRGDYDEALDYYHQAVDVDDKVPAGWFGVYMAEAALGHPEAADSAMARAQELAPGASLIHPDTNTTP